MTSQAVTYCNDVIVTQNQLRFVIGRHILVKTFSKRLRGFVYTFAKLHDRRIPSR